jgi:hypothetical protein
VKPVEDDDGLFTEISNGDRENGRVLIIDEGIFKRWR